jgi:hypothetical protein
MLCLARFISGAARRAGAEVSASPGPSASRDVYTMPDSGVASYSILLSSGTAFHKPIWRGLLYLSSAYESGRVWSRGSSLLPRL